MRYLVLALAFVGTVTGASAADYSAPYSPPVSRAAPTYVPGYPVYASWQGFYAGGQIGYGVAHVDFSQATKSLVAYALRVTTLEDEVHPSDWEVLGNSDTHVSSVGGFIGYNSQWDDIILGLEFNYSFSSFSATATATPISRRTSAGGNVYDVTVTGAASMKVTDFGTLRARAGWVVGDFMPYAMVGIAVGRADVARSATVSGEENPTVHPTVCDGTAVPPCTPFSFTQSDGKSGAFIYGGMLGIGVDFALMQNVFVRAEAEYVAFKPINGISASVATARLGLGLKF